MTLLFPQSLSCRYSYASIEVLLLVQLFLLSEQHTLYGQNRGIQPSAQRPDSVHSAISSRPQDSAQVQKFGAGGVVALIPCRSHISRPMGRLWPCMLNLAPSQGAIPGSSPSVGSWEGAAPGS